MTTPAASPVSLPAPGGAAAAFPRDDAPRRARLNQLANELDARWQARRTGGDSPLAVMARVAHAAPDVVFDAMAPHFADHRWVAAMLEEALTAMRADPFASPPLRAFQGGAMIGVVLAEAGPVTLSVMIRRWDSAPAPAPRPGLTPPDAVMFSGGHGMTGFIDPGGATITHYAATLSEAERAGIYVAAAARPCRCTGAAPARAGDVIRVDQVVQSFNLSGGTGDTVMLQLFVAGPCAVPMREHDAATGALRRLASTARAHSFRQMTLAMLRTMHRRDAAPLFAAALDEPDFALRWQVMREFVALDPAAALPHLAAMASADPHPELRRCATAAHDIVTSAIAAHAAAQRERETA
ncbi:MAG: hypothetical protein RLZZ58_746 [Pseudomonadota bacterium]